MIKIVSGLPEKDSIVFTVYLDESGSPDSTKAVSVAGFVATTQQWAMFNENWKAALNHFGVSALHMRDYSHSLREFETWRGDKRKREQFLARLINIITTRVRHSFASGVLMDDFRQVNQKFKLEEFIKPYALAGRTCVADIAKWAKKYGVAEDLIAYVFEDGAQDRGDLIYRLKNDGKSNFSFAPKSHPALQAADLLAYEHFLATCRVADGRVEPYDQLRTSIRKLDVINGNPGTDWGTYREKDLEEFCVNVHIKQR